MVAGPFKLVKVTLKLRVAYDKLMKMTNLNLMEKSL